MSLRIGAILTLSLALAVPIFHARAAEPTASAAPSGPTTATLSAVEKANLISKLKAAKIHEKEARKSGSQDPARLEEFRKRIYDINVLITKIGNNEDVALSEVDRALAQAH
jgi:hypothetical protein